jgi:3-hydroxyisobutyrate dehydrogenase-like beta-hydroxyacid dehydrogenase
MRTIGLVGVGKIGLEVAKHLLAANYRVLGYRRSSLADFEKAGGTPARSPAHIAQEVDIILTCLPGGSSLDEVANGPDGLIQCARPGQIVVEIGSHPLSAKERQLEVFAAKGVTFLDGEVSGTPGMVAQRKAPVYLAGDPQACKTVEPVVHAFAEMCMYLGPFGAASKIKFINNLLVTVNTAAIGEAVWLALKAGIDPETMIKAISNGSGGSVLFPIRANRMVKRDYVPPGGTIEGLSHYFEYIGDLARAAGVATPLFNLSVELFRRGMASGRGEQDVAAVMEVIADMKPRSGAPVTP